MDTNSRGYLILITCVCLRAWPSVGNKMKAIPKDIFCKYLFAKKLNIEKFQGVSLSDLPFVERLFKISLSVYTLVKGEEGYSATLLSRTSSRCNETIYLHFENNHFCLITDLKNYTNSYKFVYCSKLLTF